MQDGTENHPDPDRATRRTIWASFGLGSLIAAGASYLHSLDVALAADGRGLVSYFIPVLADLTIFASSANALDAHRNGEKVPALTKLSLGLSIAVTVGMNVASGFPQEVPAWLVNVWPPVAFLLLLESLMGFARRLTRRRGGRVLPTGVPCPHGVGDTLAEAVRNAYEHARGCLGEPVTFVELGAAFGQDRKKVAAMVKDSQPEPAFPPAGAPAGGTAPAGGPPLGPPSVPAGAAQPPPGLAGAHLNGAGGGPG